MIVELKLFAIARQLAGADVLPLELPAEATVADLRRVLVAQAPALESISAQLMFAVNEEYAADHVKIPPGADLACIPPVSGG